VFGGQALNPRIIATVIAVPVAALAGLVVYSMGMPATSSAPEVQNTSPVTLQASPLASGPAAVCHSFVTQLPSAVRAKQRRPVTEGTDQNAAYGDPPMIVQCGVAAAHIQPTDELYRLDDVCWHYREDSGATVWTTVDRSVAVRVTVPGTPTASSQWTIAFSEAVAKTQPALKNVPSGCDSLAEPLPTTSG
jgi:Ni,Fe-hydrogenase III small subunit